MVLLLSSACFERAAIFDAPVLVPLHLDLSIALLAVSVWVGRHDAFALS